MPIEGLNIDRGPKDVFGIIVRNAIAAVLTIKKKWAVTFFKRCFWIEIICRNKLSVGTN